MISIQPRPEVEREIAQTDEGLGYLLCFCKNLIECEVRIQQSVTWVTVTLGTLLSEVHSLD